MTHQNQRSPRRFDMDWLRVIFVCGLIMIHVAAMFDRYPLTAVKGKPSFALTLFATFLHEWRLAILFIVSGAGSYFALGFLNGPQFMKMRVRRIVVPLIMGTLLIVPIHLYYWQFLNNPNYDKTYPHFYFTIMWRFFAHGIFGTSRETLHWAHLWFLAYLFVASIVALPLMLYLRRGKGKEWIPKVATFVEKPWVIFLFAIPLMLVEVALRPFWQSSRLIIGRQRRHFLAQPRSLSLRLCDLLKRSHPARHRSSSLECAGGWSGDVCDLSRLDIRFSSASEKLQRELFLLHGVSRF